MKTKRHLIQICILCAAILPLVVQAQDYTYTTNNGTITITEYIGSESAVIIPDTINDLPVTSIGDYAFPYSTNLTSVTIGDGITNIGDYAFADCTTLNTIAVDALNSYYCSLDGVLFNQGKTTLIQYPASKVGNSYTIPNSVISIGSAAFYYTFGLTNLTIPNGVASIGLEAFYDCINLNSIIIPNSVTDIGDWAFDSCTSLTNITIPNNITSIGNFAFLYCVSLTGVYFQGNAPNIGGDVFDYDNNVTVYYLPGTTGWENFQNEYPDVSVAPWFLPNPLILNYEPTFGVHNNQFGFTISWATNVPVVVEACTDLVNSVWLPTSTNTLTAGASSFSDPQWTNYSARYYRLRSP